MAFELPPLPFPKNALEPYTSAKTLEFHHGKHHQTYVNTLNELIEGMPLERQSLEEIVKATYKDETKTKVFNNAAQVWNHNFFWNCLKPNAGGAPKGDIAQAIERDLGGFHKFEEDFKKAAVEQFGSGWAWLVDQEGKLEVLATSNADTPMARGVRCLLTLDVWEHAYYVDYRNQRERYVQAVIEKRLNWAFAQENLNRR